MTRTRPSLSTLAVTLLAALVAGSITGCALFSSAPDDEAADVIFEGTILTLTTDDAEAQALAIRGEEILAVGSKRDVRRHRGSRTRVVSLGDRALLPGFIDAHGHVSNLAAFAGMANVASPPVGPIENIEQLKETLRAYADETANPEDPGSQWILGAGYDDSLLAEGRHPTRDDLDAVSLERPVFITHVSLHLAVANSKALELAGIHADTLDPKGGVIRRRPGSFEPDGVLEETAAYALFMALPTPTPQQALSGLQLALADYASNGFTTVQDGAGSSQGWQLLAAAEAQGLLRQDVAFYPTWREPELFLERARVASESMHRLRLAGVKLVLDGSPQGKTAFLTEPYFVPPAEQSADYRGYPSLEDDEVVDEMIRIEGLGFQIMAHGNGDAAIDQMIAGVDTLDAAKPGADRRPILIHGQTARTDQIEDFVRLRIVPSYFSAHTYFWGDWHRDSVLGPERGARISPTATTRASGIPFSVHMDAPVLPPDSMRMIWATVNRITRSGKVLGPDERIPVMAAFAATTRDAAYQQFEEDRKGTLEAGKLADLVVLDRDPRSVPSEDLADLEILETWSRGALIYETGI